MRSSAVTELNAGKQCLRVLLPLFLLLAAAMPAAETTASGAASYTPAERDALVRLARERKLADHPYWHVLLHVRTRLGRSVSRVDDPAFFLAPTGKHDLAAELHADLEAFFAAPPATGPAPADRFPARLDWLCAELGIDRDRLPLAGCRELDTALAEFQPRTAYLVFPTAFMNTPASMFGHTLIKVKGQQKSDLLARAINYAAVTTETNGFIFAFKGMFGFYRGYYSLLPYYQKVQEYSDIDQRDIWEYQLNLDTTEVRRMLLHIWELRNIYSDYFFFDENCAYNLLYLLDAARPELKLTRSGRPWIIPLDTVKQLQATGTVVGKDYRASRTTRVRYIAGLLDDQRQELARRAALGLATPADILATAGDVNTHARTLDLAAEYLQGLRGRQKVSQADYQPRFLGLLQARSKLGRPAVSDYAPPPPAVSPDGGHPSSRLALSVGQADGRAFTEIAYRPAYHDLFDPPEGYLDGVQIDFTDVVLRVEEFDNSRVRLERLDFLNLLSLAPRDRFYQPISWKGDIALRREYLEHGERHYLGVVNGGLGMAWSLCRGLAYALTEGELQCGNPEADYAVGFGASAGFLSPLGRRWCLDLHARALGYPLGDQHADVSAGGLLRYTLATNQAITLELGRRLAWEHGETTIALRWHGFF